MGKKIKVTDEMINAACRVLVPCPRCAYDLDPSAFAREVYSAMRALETSSKRAAAPSKKKR